VSLEPVDYAWMSVGGIVLGWNLLCKDGCTMSERADDYVLAHRGLVLAFAYTLTAHVTNTIPNRMDPIHWGFVALRRIRR
jgi:hypothetical protein